MNIRPKILLIQKNTAFCSFIYVCIAFLIFPASLVHGKNDKVYTISKFRVEAVAKNAVAAKRKAISEGQRKALIFLFKRLTPYTSYSRLPRLDKRTVEALITGISVRSEKNSRVKYLATLDFSFQADGVRKLLRSYSIPILEEQSKKVVIVPVYVSDDNSKKSKISRRIWRKQWSKLDLSHTLVPLQLGHVKAAVTNENMKALLEGDQGLYNGLKNDYLATYKAEYFILALAYPSEKTGHMAVKLIGDDSAGAFQLSRNYKLSGRTISSAALKATIFSQKVLEARWKVVNSDLLGEDLLASAPETLLVTVLYSGFKQWQKIRKKIESVPGIDSIEVGVFSARGAEISLSYPGGGERLSQQLLRYNLTLENANGSWVLKGS